MTISKDGMRPSSLTESHSLSNLSAFFLKFNWLQMGFTCDFQEQHSFYTFWWKSQVFSLHTLNVTFSTVLYQEISLFYLQKQLVLHYSLDDFLFEMDSIQLMLMLEMVSVMVAWESKTCLKWISVSVNHPKIWFWILLSGCFTFPCKLITRICCYIKTTTLPDKFCVFSLSVCWKSMNISGRSCMLIRKRLLKAFMYSWPVISHSFY